MKSSWVQYIWHQPFEALSLSLFSLFSLFSLLLVYLINPRNIIYPTLLISTPLLALTTLATLIPDHKL